MARKKKERGNNQRSGPQGKVKQSQRVSQRVVVNVGSNQVRRRRAGRRSGPKGSQTAGTQVVSASRGGGIGGLGTLMMGMVSAMSNARAMGEVSARNDGLRLGEGDRMKVIQQMGAIEEEKKEMARRNAEEREAIRLEREMVERRLEEGKSIIPTALMAYEQKTNHYREQEISSMNEEELRKEAKQRKINLGNTKNLEKMRDKLRSASKRWKKD